MRSSHATACPRRGLVSSRATLYQPIGGCYRSGARCDQRSNDFWRSRSAPPARRPSPATSVVAHMLYIPNVSAIAQILIWRRFADFTKPFIRRDASSRTRACAGIAANGTRAAQAVAEPIHRRADVEGMHLIRHSARTSADGRPRHGSRAARMRKTRDLSHSAADRGRCRGSLLRSMAASASWQQTSAVARLMRSSPRSTAAICGCVFRSARRRHWRARGQPAACRLRRRRPSCDSSPG